MSEEIKFDLESSDEEIYRFILKQFESIINTEEPVTGNLANITAVLNSAFNKISWVGFYLSDQKNLFLGPFQGNIACTVIPIGKGVCGISAEKKETIIVEDVNKFPGHIACDADTKSEIVVPLISDDRVVGVLDLDSMEYSSFNEIDKKYLEELCKLVASKLDFNRYTIN